MNIQKEKLPAGWSYALKPSRLEGAIAESQVKLPISLAQLYKVWELNTPVLSAKFNPPGSHKGGEAGSFSVTSCAIPSCQREAFQEFVEHIFLPSLMRWIASIEALPRNSTLKREEQDFLCDGLPLALNKRPLALIAKGQRIAKKRV